MLYGAESIINSVIAKTICYILYKDYCLHLIYQMLRKEFKERLDSSSSIFLFSTLSSFFNCTFSLSKFSLSCMFIVDVLEQ